jgi:hypothetical protein
MLIFCVLFYFMLIRISEYILRLYSSRTPINMNVQPVPVESNPGPTNVKELCNSHICVTNDCCI